MPEPDGFYLSPDDKRLFEQLKKLGAEFVPQLGANPRPRTHMAPEVYLAALENGHKLAAEAEGVPGSASCKIYRIEPTSHEGSGSLTVRTSASAGTIMMDDSGHEIDDDDLLELHWDGGERFYVVAGEVLGTNVPISKGNGTDLPDTGTNIQVYSNTYQIVEVEDARKIVFNTTSTEITGTGDAKYFPVVRDKFGNWLALQLGGGTVKSHVLQPQTDMDASTNSSGSWLNGEFDLWVLKQSTEGDILEYARDEEDEKITVSARNLTTYNIKGSTEDIETNANLVPQICYAIEDARGQLWVIKSYPDGPAKHIRFALPSGGLLTTQLLVPDGIVIEAWDGYHPGSTVFLRNKAITTDYQFYGDAGAIGMACLDPFLNQYRIYDLQCPPPEEP